jgi:hypothetical protein
MSSAKASPETERAGLCEFLDMQREALIEKVQGLLNLRWVALHMIEETARHAGHADIIRETIDGSRGV